MVPHLPTCLRSYSSFSFRGLGWRGGEGHKRKSKDDVGPVLESPPPPPSAAADPASRKLGRAGGFGMKGEETPFLPLRTRHDKKRGTHLKKEKAPPKEHKRSPPSPTGTVVQALP